MLISVVMLSPASVVDYDVTDKQIIANITPNDYYAPLNDVPLDSREQRYIYSTYDSLGNNEYKIEQTTSNIIEQHKLKDNAEPYVTISKPIWVVKIYGIFTVDIDPKTIMHNEKVNTKYDFYIPE